MIMEGWDGDLTFVALRLLCELGQVDVIFDRHCDELFFFYTMSHRVNDLFLLSGIATVAR